MQRFAKKQFGGICIDLIDLPPLGELESMWRELENRSEISFFTSWSWIGSWLGCLPSDVHPMLLRARLNGRLIGAGIVVGSVMWKARCIPMRVWRLNETGRPELDKLTIEYNGLVIDDTVKHLVEPLMVQYLLDQGSEWDELQFNALRRPVTPPRLGLRSVFRSLRTRLKRVRHPAYQVCLVDVREAGEHVRLIKQKPRYHIRRSFNAYQQWGAVTIEAASTLDQALAWLERLKHFHRAYWATRSQEGAFLTDFFNDFHDRLIRANFERDEIQILRIQAGDREIAYLYNFVWNGHVYNYQSGVNYAEMGGKLSPGMLAHTLAIDLNAAAGHHTYDLMAGDHHYKRALTLQTVQLDWWAARRPTLPVKAEDSVRRAARLATRIRPLVAKS